MLNSLHIENIAVIECADITLSGGFNVLTGETGAGKSIVIDSINAVLGARTSKEIIRNGCSNARVLAEFTNISPETQKIIEDYGYSLDDGKLIIQRTLSEDSRGGFKVNGLPATSGVIKDIGVNLINIHGQHDNQTLLNPEKHCLYIDKIANNSEILTDYYAEFKNLNSIRRQLEALDMDEAEKLRKIDLLKYQISELENANITLGEHEKLKEKLKLAKEFEQTNKRLNFALSVLNSGEEPGVIDLLKESHKNLSKINSEKLNLTTQKLLGAVEELCDIESEIEYFINNDLVSTENIDIIQDRIELLNNLMLKYAPNEEGLLEFLNNAKQELNAINLLNENSAKLEAELLKSEERLIKKAQALTDSRINAAKNFENNVCGVLKYLDMPNVVFKVSITKSRYSKNGCDAVEFLISANAGETVKPLAKIASGGELSRVMLAIKSVLAKADEVETLIFDEIDSGISGRAANKVAAQLKKVSNAKQVICVTHLAQIAAFATNHMLIEKSVKNDRTYTNVYSLDYNSRIDEIARIMSGTEITENLFNSAKELLDRSLNYENL
ncbi:MAG: DNA repair protein RecN [Clostridia bacterium]|nr:DNA repair protein RecN [Clostridia bacterium]